MVKGVRRMAAEKGVAADGGEVKEAMTYFTDQGREGRMDDAPLVEAAIPIGSGVTEAACKVVGARLKGSGMRWVEEGAARVAPLRALYLSGSDV